MQAQSVTEIVEQMAATLRKQGSISLKECAAMLGHRNLVLMLLLLSLLNSLPIVSIPGFSTITGIPIVILGFKLLIGAQHVGLSEKVKAYRLKSPKLAACMEKILPFLRGTERWLKPRWLALSEPPARNLLGGIFVIFGLLLVLPIPFLNAPLGITLTLLAIGLLEQDGMLIAFGLFCASLALIGAVSLAYFAEDMIETGTVLAWFT